MFSRLICASGEYRAPPASRPYAGQSLSCFAPPASTSLFVSISHEPSATKAAPIKIPLAHERVLLFRLCLAVILLPSKVESLTSSAAVVFLGNKCAAIIQGRTPTRLGQAGTTRDECDREHGSNGCGGFAQLNL